MKTNLFDFKLPPERIATEPVSPRDASRMLVVRPDGLQDEMTAHLADYVKPGDVMVFNDTKVIPVQLSGRRISKEMGVAAGIEVTLLKSLSAGRWSGFAKPAKKLSIGDKVIFAEDFWAEVAKKAEGVIELVFNSSDIMDKLHAHGRMPLPPYMKREAQGADNQNYQTVYASKEGAVAAPTAGLHFTHELLSRIDAAGVKRIHVTLHVGAGTFQPVKVEDTDEHRMHSEYCELSDINAAILNNCRKSGGRVIAVGTTSLRVLESAPVNDNGGIMPFSGETEIFITPGYRFKNTDMLLTNFHLPKSTLFMLVSAFMGLERMQEAYSHAVEANYRFYSYGDACLLIP